MASGAGTWPIELCGVYGINGSRLKIRLFAAVASATAATRVRDCGYYNGVSFPSYQYQRTILSHVFVNIVMLSGSLLCLFSVVFPDRTTCHATAL